MALTLQFPSPSTATTFRRPRIFLHPEPPSKGHASVPLLGENRSNAISAAWTARQNGYFSLVAKSLEENQESSQGPTDSEASGSEESATELGAQIKAAMEDRKKTAREEDLLSGVAEEVRQIEWPVFRKVLGTTGVVLGVIAGSSVVLLTVNFVLAELSDRVFAGKGVQDFF